MPKPIETFLSTLDQHADESIPSWLSAAVTRLIFDFSQPPVSPPPALILKGNPEALGLHRIHIPDINSGEIITGNRIIGEASDIESVDLDPTDPIDINAILKFHGLSEPSATAPLDLVQRVAGIIRAMARVLALKNTSEADKDAIGKAILWITDLANHLRELGGGEVDFRAVRITRVQTAADDTPKGQGSRNKTPEERALQSQRMKEAWARRKQREKQEAFHRHEVERSQPSSDGTTFRDGSEATGTDSAAA